MRRRDGLPSPAVLDPRYSVQLAPCTVCGHTLEHYVTTCIHPVSGVTVLRCPKCKTVETEAMRIAARKAAGAVIVRETPPETLICARVGCGTSFVRPKRSTRVHCCRSCTISDQWERRQANDRESVEAWEAKRAKRREIERRSRARKRGVGAPPPLYATREVAA